MSHFRRMTLGFLLAAFLIIPGPDFRSRPRMPGPIRWFLKKPTAPAPSLKTPEPVYQPNWASLDARPTPQWFRDAKFGIFICWGLYSVPAWSPKGEYAEWYQYALREKQFGGAVADYHAQEIRAGFQIRGFRTAVQGRALGPLRLGRPGVAIRRQVHGPDHQAPRRRLPLAERRGQPRLWPPLEHDGDGARRDIVGELVRGHAGQEHQGGALLFSI